jgi:hypothetical protein
MGKSRLAVLILSILLVAGCGGGKIIGIPKSKHATETVPSMKQQVQDQMDQVNKALPYIVAWSAYKTGEDQAKYAAELVAHYPSLKKYLNAQGLFNVTDWSRVEYIIDTEDPL